MDKHEVDLIKGYSVEYETLEEVLEAVELCVEGSILSSCTDELRRNKKAVDAVVEWLGEDFQYASLELRSNKDIALKAYYYSTDRSTNLDYIGNNLKDDESFLEEIIEIDYENDVAELNGDHISERLKNDKKFATFALSKFGKLIKIFSDKIQNDADLQKIALENGATMKDIGVTTIDDEKVALSMVEKIYDFYDSQFNMLSERIKNDKNFTLKAIKENPNYYSYINESLKNDLDVASLLVLQYPDKFNALPASFKEDRNFVFKLASQNLKILSYNPNLLKDKDFMLELIKENPKAIEYLNILLRHNKDFMQKVIKINPDAKQLLPQKK
ncbi:MAG: DUF4116 domain-containing protein [Clostridia bacterium]|nr:DUF4116 domain-containing protein [Clostridia bacterium]